MLLVVYLSYDVLIAGLKQDTYVEEYKQKVEMAMKFEIVLVILLVGALCYPLIMRFLLEKLHPSRLQMIKFGNDLLRSEKLTTHQMDMIRSSMQASFSWWPMALVIFIMPFYLMKNGLTKNGNGVKFPGDHELEQKYALFQEYQGKSIMAANPIFSLIAIIEVLIYLTLKGMLRSSVPSVAYKSVSFSFLSFENRRSAHAA